MDLKEAMATLKKLGNEQQLKTWRRHGATGECYGVKIGDMKVLLKKVKGRQDLALELYDTGNLDAMYFAGLLADGAQMSKKEVKAWAAASIACVACSREARWNVPITSSGRAGFVELKVAWAFWRLPPITSS